MDNSSNTSKLRDHCCIGAVVVLGVVALSVFIYVVVGGSGSLTGAAAKRNQAFARATAVKPPHNLAPLAPTDAKTSHDQSSNPLPPPQTYQDPFPQGRPLDFFNSIRDTAIRGDVNQVAHRELLKATPSDIVPGVSFAGRDLHKEIPSQTEWQPPQSVEVLVKAPKPTYTRTFTRPRAQ